MPSLKEYRDRIASVTSTRKITSAMKMVAAAKLRKAQEAAEASQPYARAMSGMMKRVASGVSIGPSSPKLLVGTGADKVHLLVVMTSDRGLCGGFNANIVRLARQEILRLEEEGKTVKLLCVGRKGRDALRRDFADKLLESFINIGGKEGIGFAEVDKVTGFILDTFGEGEFDVCTLLCNEFVNVLSQKPRMMQLIPLSLPEEKGGEEEGLPLRYSFEPEEDELLKALLPKNVGVQIYRAMLDSAAGEQAARMTAMDSATGNASDMIDDLTLQYNRARQAYITKELIEIISGSEAV